LPNFEVDQSTVSRDLKAIQRQWKESIRDFDLIGNRNCSGDAMQKELAGGERSQQSKETSLMRDGYMNWETCRTSETCTRTEQKVGEAAF